MGERHVPMASVIIPTYNRERIIKRAIQSVLTQTFQDFEIVIVDDGSTDGTKTVVESFSDPRIRYLQHERNRGAAAARNTGIKAACGEYLAFLDSDDEWLSNKLSEQMSVLVKAPIGVSASCTGYDAHLLESGMILRKVPHQPSSWLKHFLLQGCEVSPGATLLAHRSVFEKIGLFDEAFFRYEDWDWLIRYAKHYDLVFIGKPLAQVYVGSRPRGGPLEQSTVHFIEKYFKDLQRFGSYQRRKTIARLWFQVTEAYFREGKFGKGFRFFFKAFLQNPIQRPGLYLLLVDAMFGTSLGLRASRLKKRLLRQQL